MIYPDHEGITVTEVPMYQSSRDMDGLCATTTIIARRDLAD